ncbi:hypothetical protein MMC17_009465 [Xylographa soralifera]|nr:hypothetical protein [Xylographa soralifera]
MSSDIRLQCFCSAFFPTSDAFRAHLNEYRTLEGYLSAQLEIYRSHSKVNSDDPDSDDDDPDVYEDAERPGIKIFGGILSNVGLCLSPPSGIVNFNADVKDYIRYAERHQDVGKIKIIYINQMYDELRKRAADELDLAERLFYVERGNKRAREVGDVGSRTLGVRRAKLHGVGITNELDFQPANGIDPLEMSSLSLY